MSSEVWNRGFALSLPVAAVIAAFALAGRTVGWADAQTKDVGAYRIEGVVEDQETKERIPDVKVEVDNSLGQLMDSTFTDSTGYFSLQDVPTSVNDPNKRDVAETFEIGAYPNPTSGIVSFDLEENSGVKYTVINQRGRVIAQFTRTGNNSARIDLSQYNLADGILFIVADDGKSRYVSKVTYMKNAPEIREGIPNINRTLRKSAFDSLDVILKFLHPDYVQKTDTVRLDHDLSLEIFLERKRKVSFRSLYPDPTIIPNARYEITNEKGEKEVVETDENGIVNIKLAKGRHYIKPIDERIRDISKEVLIKSDTSFYLINRVNFVKQDSVVQGEEDNPKIVNIGDLFRVPAGIDSICVMSSVPDSILNVERIDSSRIRLMPGKDKNRNNSFMEFLLKVFSHGDYDSAKVRFDVEPRSDLTIYLEETDNDTLVPGWIKVQNDSFYVENGILRLQLKNIHIDYFVIKGQRLRNDKVTPWSFIRTVKIQNNYGEDYKQP